MEITLALGLAAFATLALFGLLSVGLDGGRSATNDTAIARTSEGVVSRLKQRPFAELSGLSEDFLFDEAGMIVNSTTDAVSRCSVEIGDFSLPGLLPPTSAGSILRIRMSFYSPPQSPQPIDYLETVLSQY